MSQAFTVARFAVLIATCAFYTQAGELPMDTIKTEQGDLQITFVGHGSLFFEFNGSIIHVDPWTSLADYPKLPKADAILITHGHRDHLDPEAIKAVRKPHTTIVVAKVVGQQVEGAVTLANGDQQTVKHLTVEAVPAYNLKHTRPTGEPFHPKGDGNGYVITFGNYRVYVAGDTENIPEMADLKDIDCAFLPMNLPYTMTPKMAADAARTVKPAILYPYHFGETDTAELIDLLKDTGIDVRIRPMK